MDALRLEDLKRPPHRGETGDGSAARLQLPPLAFECEPDLLPSVRARLDHLRAAGGELGPVFFGAFPERAAPPPPPAPPPPKLTRQQRRRLQTLNGKRLV